MRRKWDPKEMALGAAGLVAVLGLLTFYVWYQTEAVHLGRAIAKVETDIQALKDDIARLELRKAELLAPGRVEKIAREELGLVDPKPDEIIYKDGTTSR